MADEVTNVAGNSVGTAAAKKHDLAHLFRGPVAGRDFDPLMYPVSLPLDYLTFPSVADMGAAARAGRTEQIAPLRGATLDGTPVGTAGAPETLRPGPDAPWPAGMPHLYEAFRALASLRHSMPFIPIHPVPSQMVTAILAFVAAAAVPYDLVLPERAVLLEFKCSAPLFYVSFNGNAKIPVAADLVGDFGRNYMSLINPTGRLYYCGGTKTVSVICPTDAAVVQAQCFVSAGNYALPTP